MTYYYNNDGKFQTESSVEYKTQKGAVDRMNKEGRGAVYDETGQLLISLVDKKDVPEGALDTDADGNVPVYNEKNEQVSTVDAEAAALAAGETPDNSDKSEEDQKKTDESEQSGEDLGELDVPEKSEERPEELDGMEKSEQSEQMKENMIDLALKQEADVKPTFRQHPNTGILFTVHTTCDLLRIRSGAGYIYPIVGYIDEKLDGKRDYDIVEEKDGFGKLADGSGWIDLKQTVRVN